jgi:hypothetical protein
MIGYLAAVFIMGVSRWGYNGPKEVVSIAKGGLHSGPAFG